uniref:G_PROTEIN_RECEP_F1_2 domain-containing protein n=1 Tax=Macrostomum lignano TaxID=282301 RepID=A0A1I8IMU4_9PLAT
MGEMLMKSGGVACTGLTLLSLACSFSSIGMLLLDSSVINAETEPLDAASSLTVGAVGLATLAWSIVFAQRSRDSAGQQLESGGSVSKRSCQNAMKLLGRLLIAAQAAAAGLLGFVLALSTVQLHRRRVTCTPIDGLGLAVKALAELSLVAMAIVTMATVWPSSTEDNSKQAEAWGRSGWSAGPSCSVIFRWEETGSSSRPKELDEPWDAVGLADLVNGRVRPEVASEEAVPGEVAMAGKGHDKGSNILPILVQKDVSEPVRRARNRGTRLPAVLGARPSVPVEGVSPVVDLTIDDCQGHRDQGGRAEERARAAPLGEGVCQLVPRKPCVPWDPLQPDSIASGQEVELPGAVGDCPGVRCGVAKGLARADGKDFVLEDCGESTSVLGMRGNYAAVDDDADPKAGATVFDGSVRVAMDLLEIPVTAGSLSRFPADKDVQRRNVEEGVEAISSSERLKEDVIEGANDVQEDPQSKAITKHGLLEFIDQDVQRAFSGATRPKSVLAFKGQDASKAAVSVSVKTVAHSSASRHDVIVDGWPGDRWNSFRASPKVSQSVFLAFRLHMSLLDRSDLSHALSVLLAKMQALGGWLASRGGVLRLTSESPGFLDEDEPRLVELGVTHKVDRGCDAVLQINLQAMDSLVADHYHAVGESLSRSSSSFSVVGDPQTSMGVSASSAVRVAVESSADVSPAWTLPSPPLRASVLSLPVPSASSVRSMRVAPASWFLAWSSARWIRPDLRVLLAGLRLRFPVSAARTALPGIGSAVCLGFFAGGAWAPVPVSEALAFLASSAFRSSQRRMTRKRWVFCRSPSLAKTSLPSFLGQFSFGRSSRRLRLLSSELHQMKMQPSVLADLTTLTGRPARSWSMSAASMVRQALSSSSAVRSCSSPKTMTAGSPSAGGRPAVPRSRRRRSLRRWLRVRRASAEGPVARAGMSPAEPAASPSAPGGAALVPESPAGVAGAPASAGLKEADDAIAESGKDPSARSNTLGIRGYVKQYHGLQAGKPDPHTQIRPKPLDGSPASEPTILLYYYGTANRSLFSPENLTHIITFRMRYETELVLSFVISILKSIGYPLGLLLQTLAVIYLVRGNHGYPPSARSWFLLVLGADIGSTLYRLYDLITVDFNITNPFIENAGVKGNFGQLFIALMWGLRRRSDALIQGIFCKAFFMVMYFPIYLSPIALTINSLIRCYCVKHPLRAAQVPTVCADRALKAFAVVLSLTIAIIAGMLSVDGWFSLQPVITTLGETVFYGDCAIPRMHAINTDFNLVLVSYWFTLAIVLIICVLNILSAVIIIKVLFSGEIRASTNDSNAEIRAAAMILGMNITLFVCFFGSRIMLLVSGMIDKIDHPLAYVVLERTSAYLFNIPYYTNVLFIAGFTKKFYRFFMPCLSRRESTITTTAPATSMKVLSREQDMG